MLTKIIVSDFSSPFFITYFNTSLFSLYLLFYTWNKEWRQLVWADIKHLLRKTRFKLNTSRPGTERDGELSNIISTAFFFCFLWFIANYVYSLALVYSNISSVTTLSSLSGLFILLIGTVVKSSKDPFTMLKLLITITSFIGVALICKSDISQEGGELDKRKLFGDFLAIVSAFFYGCYLTTISQNLNETDKDIMAQFFGFVGVINIILLWPFFIFLHYTGIEPFALPDFKNLMCMLLNGLIGTVVADYIWLYATVLTSPLVSSLGLGFTIPLADIVDLMFFNAKFQLLYFVPGTVLVVFSFTGINLISDSNFCDWFRMLLLNRGMSHKSVDWLVGSNKENSTSINRETYQSVADYNDNTE